LELEVVLIIVLFGGILAIMLYKYLLQSPEYKGAEKHTEKNVDAEDSILEPLAERVFILFQKVETLEKNFTDLESYLEQKVEIWKKKEGEKGAKQ
jgi:hypothetical protein